MLEDLVKVGATAPSAVNAQLWTFTILPTRQAVLSLGRRVLSFFKLVSWAADRSALRLASRAVVGDALETFHREYGERVKQEIARFEGSGRERLFHGATAAILVGSSPGGFARSEDSLLAAQNILLAAHAMGLGSCLIGFVVAAMRHDPRIKQALGMPREERVHAVVALGHPDERYERIAGRKPIDVRVWEG